MTIIHEYFLSYDITKLIRSLEELVAPKNILTSWCMMLLSLSM